MYSTIVTTKTNRINMSDTLRETAIYLRKTKKEFHASEIVNLLKEQGVEVTTNKVRSTLCYDGGFYTGKVRKFQYWYLRKLEGGMYRWERYEYDPQAPAKEMVKLIVEE